MKDAGMEADAETEADMDEKRELGFDVDLGQRQRYEAISKKLYSEKLRFKGNKSLREADVTLMEGRDSRKVRRIEEGFTCLRMFLLAISKAHLHVSVSFLEWHAIATE